MPKYYLLVLVLLVTFACDKKNEKKLYDDSTSADSSHQTKTEPAVVEDSTGINVGDLAPEINLPSNKGKVISLSSLRGKIVLLDFWASWCGPCRQENPNVVKVYNKYKDKGFEIYSVSLDMDKGQWLHAIETDHLTWTHVSDLGYWNSVVVPKYQISGIPATFLLDKEGKIIARDLRGEELDKKLAEVFK
jgi:peroxiredoxin